MKIFIRKYILLLLLGLSFAFSANAQYPASLYYLENIPQSNFLNPAMVPRTNFFIGIPTIYGSLGTELSPGNLIQPNGNTSLNPLKDGFNYGKLYKRIGKSANIDVEATVMPIVFGWRGKRGYVTVGVSEKISANIAVPKAFFEMAEIGFPDGSSYDFSTIGVNTIAYTELSLGYTYQFSQRFRAGVHAKALFGTAAVITKFNNFSLNTSEQEWSYNIDGTIHGSFPADMYIGDDGVVDSVDVPEISPDQFILKNPGFAFDFGAVYEIDDKWIFSAALNDVGFINWNSNLNNISSKGNYSFQGVNVPITDIDNMEELFTEMGDSIANTIEVSHDTTQSFRQFLAPKMYLGAAYNVNHYFTVGFLSKTAFYRKNIQQELTLSANVNMYKFLTTSLSYNLTFSGYNSVGLGLGFRGGPLQWYLMVDYVPIKYNDYNIVDSNKEVTTVPWIPDRLDRISIMTGLNIIIGANGFQNEPIIDAYSEF